MEQHPIKINKVQIRNLQIEDYAQLSQSFTRVYSDGPYALREPFATIPR